jgi:thiol-disulfide isomerase/thioredoxin
MKKCSKCQVEKNLSEFASNKSQYDGYQNYCKPCKKTSDKKWYDSNPKIWKAKNKSKSEKRKNLLEELKKELGGKCDKCGENRKHVLDFHHIDKSKKLTEISTSLRMGSWEEDENIAREEIKKCVLLCSNCHRDFHHLERIKGTTTTEYLK